VRCMILVKLCAQGGQQPYVGILARLLE